MFLFRKLLCAVFIAIQLTALQINAEMLYLANVHSDSSFFREINNLELKVNDKLDLLQKQAKEDGKFFELLKIEFTRRHAYIFYHLCDRMGETNSSITHIIFKADISEQIGKHLQEKIEFLQNFAFAENKIINFLEIEISKDENFGYIIYEISDS